MSILNRKSGTHGEYSLTREEFEKWLTTKDWDEDIKEIHRDGFNYYYPYKEEKGEVLLTFDSDGLSYGVSGSQIK